MTEDWRENIGGVFNRSIPLLVSLFMILFSYIPLSSSLANNARPLVGLLCIYFWLIYRPDLFNLFSVFILGLTADILSATPLGINIFSFLIMYLLVTNFLRYLNGKPFIVLWFGFALFLLPVILSKWLLLSIFYSSFMPAMLLLFSYLITVCFYPIINGVNSVALNLFLKE